MLAGKVYLKYDLLDHMAQTSNLDNPEKREASFKESEIKELEIKLGVSEIKVHNAVNTCMESHCGTKPTHCVTLDLGGLEFYVVFCPRHAEQFEIRRALRESDDVRKVDRYWNHEQNGFVMPCRDDGKQFHFHCEWCGKDHHHGNIKGHRAAHCDGTSPYNKAGYFLVKTED